MTWLKPYVSVDKLGSFELKINPKISPNKGRVHITSRELTLNNKTLF